ncbi:MAG: RNA polymerase factor sigma-54 [Thermoleophilia bacterium]
MNLKPVLTTAPTTSQQLVLSPRLYQSLSILRLGAFELQELIQKELDENPTLEIPEAADFEAEPGQVSERELWDDYLGANRGDRGGGNTATPGELTACAETLSEHLTLQLHLENLTDARRRIGLAIIGSLDEDGYLREPVEELAATINKPAAEIEDVLRIVQRFDPPGVAARNLEECLAIQLEQIGAGETAIRIVREFLPQVAHNAFGEIAKSLGVSNLKVRRAVEVIRSLCPSPGSLFDTSPPAAAVIPDVYARVDRGRIRILANREIVPSLKLSRLYQEMASKKSDAEPATTAYIKDKLQEASRLIRDIDHRRTTVTKVARAIAEAQPEFFTQGPEHLRPLGLEKIAASLDVHPSTISRALLGKYMSTPHGIFEFRYFFSSGYAAAKGGEGLAANAVKKRLAGIIAREDAQHPLSDQKLVGQLKENDISISRRTVAKYREQLGIAPSWERKKDTAGQS